MLGIGSNKSAIFHPPSLMLKQRQNTVNHLLGGISKNYGGPLSPAFLYQVMDAKAVTPKVVDTYLKKAAEVKNGNSVDNASIFTNKRQYRDMISEFRAEVKNKAEPIETLENTTENQEYPADAPQNRHYGIVGEIIDKYA